MSNALPQRPARPAAFNLALAASCGALCAALMLVGCTERKKVKVDLNAAARVNGEELTLAQVNLVLQQQRNLRPEQLEAARRQVLERLIEQELAVQQAGELDLKRDPRVQLQLDAARREVLARAYADKLAEPLARPTPDEVHAYYAAHPALFGERRIFNIQEWTIEVPADQLGAMRERFTGTHAIAEFLEYLRANNIHYVGTQALRAAEQLTPPTLDAFSRLSDGQAVLSTSATGLVLHLLSGSRPAPLTEQQAGPAIEQLLFNERKRKAVEDQLKALRAAARVEYRGLFAAPQGASPVASPASAVGG